MPNTATEVAAIAAFDRMTIQAHCRALDEAERWIDRARWARHANEDNAFEKAGAREWLRVARTVR